MTRLVDLDGVAAADLAAMSSGTPTMPPWRGSQAAPVSAVQMRRSSPLSLVSVVTLSFPPAVYGDFPQLAGLNPLKGGANIVDPWFDERPPIRPENDQREASARDVLLVRHVLICGNHDFIPCFFRPLQQRAIDKRCPPAFLRHVDVMTGEVTAKLPGRIVVKQDSHARP